jgi:hypothetical protein
MDLRLPYVREVTGRIRLEIYAGISLLLRLRMMGTFLCMVVAQSTQIPPASAGLQIQ